MKNGTRVTLGVALVLLQILDLWTTYSVLSQGGTEVNPLVRMLLDFPVLLWMVKVGGASLIAAFVAYVKSPTLDIALVVTVTFYTVVVVNNVLLLIG